MQGIDLRLRLSPKMNYWLDFLYAMTSKEIKARYKHAVFGFLWIFLNPLLQMAVMGFVFQFFIPVRVDNYFLFLFSGLLPWNLFSQSITKTTPAYFYERNLIKKAKFPRETVVLSIILSNVFHFLVALILLTLALLFDKVVIEDYGFLHLLSYLSRMLLLIPATFLLLIFTTGLSLFTSSLNVRFRDVNFIIQLLTMLWFYATPIVYSLKLLPEQLWPVFYLNPMTFIVELFHYALMGLAFTLPEFTWVSLIMIIVIFYLGIQVFRKENRNFDDWL